jgi:hypothetical protein
MQQIGIFHDNLRLQHFNASLDILNNRAGTYDVSYHRRDRIRAYKAKSGNILIQDSNVLSGNKRITFLMQRL